MPRRLRLILALVVVLVLAAAWSYFRPETAFLDRRVDDPAPNSPTTVLLSGSFAPRAHQGHGVAQVLQLADGQRVLHFADFETQDGPDLQVYLLPSPDASNRSDLEKAGFRSLGPLKGNLGPQNYAMPADVQVADYHAVAVWCQRFGVNFTTAGLAASTSTGR